MQSPASPSATLVKTEIEPGLIAFRCPDSEGLYLSAHSYWNWLGKHPERLPKLPVASDSLPEEEAPAVSRLCPETGQPMLRYKVGYGFPFTIDRSPTGSLWFDKGEWEALREHNFHDELHLIFTLPWQSKVRREQTESNIDETLRERVGDEAYEKACAFRDWLKTQPDPMPILALLRNN